MQLRNGRHPLQPALELTVSLLVGGNTRVYIKEGPSVTSVYGERCVQRAHSSYSPSEAVSLRFRSLALSYS